jgi:hypothetical protein
MREAVNTTLSLTLNEIFECAVGLLASSVSMLWRVENGTVSTILSPVVALEAPATPKNALCRSVRLTLPVTSRNIALLLFWADAGMAAPEAIMMAMSVEVVLLMTASLKRSRDVELLATD